MKARILYWPIALFVVFMCTGMSSEQDAPAVLLVTLFSASVGWFVVLRNTRKPKKAAGRHEAGRSGIERESEYQPRHRRAGEDFKITRQNLERNGYVIRDPEEADSGEWVRPEATDDDQDDGSVPF